MNPHPFFKQINSAVAEQRLVLRHIFGFLWQLITAKEKGKLEAAVFRLKAQVMAEYL